MLLSANPGKRAVRSPVPSLRQGVGAQLMRRHNPQSRGFSSVARGLESTVFAYPDQRTYCIFHEGAPMEGGCVQVPRVPVVFPKPFPSHPRDHAEDPHPRFEPDNYPYIAPCSQLQGFWCTLPCDYIVSCIVTKVVPTSAELRATPRWDLPHQSVLTPVAAAQMPLSASYATAIPSVFHCRRRTVKEYELIRKRAEWELWGDTPPRSAGRWRRGNGSRTPGVNAARPRRPNSMSVSSPQGLDAAACPPRHECSTPQAASSAFSTPASRQRR